MVYSDEIEDKIDLLIDALKKKYPGLKNLRWHAIKLLENDTEITRDYPVDLPQVLDRSYEKDIINQKYDFIDEVIQEVLVNKSAKEAITDKADQLLTHRIWGLPIFLCIMALVFFLTFTVGDWLKGYFQLGLDMISGGVAAGLEALHVAPLLNSLIVDGIIAGVGGILLFLPNIFILFLALAFLEDSGYMSRVAYVMDSIMGRLGLSGRSFIPMILGFGCTVPAIMASRALENKRDRYKTMLITPFMSCSARLPIYVLFSELFFPENSLLVAYSMYLLGIVVAIACAFVMHLLDRGKQRENSLLIELPEFKAPSARTIAIYVWEKVKDYLTKAGTTIFVASIIMWVLLNFGPSGYSQDMGEHLWLHDRPVHRAFLYPHRPGLLADCGGPYRGHLRQGSGGVLHGGALWGEQHHLHRGHGLLDERPFRHWLRPAERLLPDDLLPAVRALRGHAGHHQKGDRQLEMGGPDGGVPNCGGVGYHLCGVPHRPAVCVRRRHGDIVYRAAACLAGGGCVFRGEVHPQAQRLRRPLRRVQRVPQPAFPR